ncbi:hypothetical protein [Oceanobacillus alkalisoli]|uniref:hypothetical protein n=1 Tax=Oceanobacillus alkalisoli TaxID=2925113 RepID=UPI001EF0D27E|nr:hypothetical protein [Oceanobacillus alkalisoli]MCF3943417.1 hypothetical protein [Oceanobacillus alkalisoli]MCG5104006.1 hypothetical protein [Oceanobacillus alkalisoli]
MKLKEYYVSGNTAEGYVDSLESNLHGIEEVIQLGNASYKTNTAIIKQLIEQNKEQTQVEVLKSPISEEFLEGVIFREKKIAILGNRDCPFSNQAYDLFKKGLHIHDDLELVFIQEMDFEKADDLAKRYIEELLPENVKGSRNPQIFRRLFGTNTMDGVVNEVPNLTAHLDRVYHIKGRAGTGKSTFMKRIVKACEARGLDLEIYYCSFDPNSIDMVLIPELNICLFDSTDPHAFEPEDETKEKVIDLYKETVTPGTDEKYADEISNLTKQYKSYMKKGLAALQREGAEIIAQDAKKPFNQTEINESVDNLQMKLD